MQLLLFANRQVLDFLGVLLDLAVGAVVVRRALVALRRRLRGRWRAWLNSLWGTIGHIVLFECLLHRGNRQGPICCWLSLYSQLEQSTSVSTLRKAVRGGNRRSSQVLLRHVVPKINLALLCRKFG